MASPTILCVDDERMVLVALREQLQRHLRGECVVEIADDGATALELLGGILEEGGQVPVVVTDHIMPGIKGDELVAKIKAISARSRCVMLTGQATAEAVGNALNRGGLYRFLAKPWNQEDLVLTVREALRAFEAEREIERQRATLRDINAAAIELTGSLATAERYARLLERLRVILGAEHLAAARELRGHWVVLASTASVQGAPPAEIAQAWSAAAAGGVVQRGDVPGSGWLWERDARGVTMPLHLGSSAGLLLVGAKRDGVLPDVDDEGRLGAAVVLTSAALGTASLVDALEESNARRQRVAQELVRQANTLLAGVLHGNSEAIVALRAHISKVAAERGPVLIQGQPGSGREAIARAIHAESDRADRPFILVSGAMVRRPEELGRQLELAQGATLYIHGLGQLAPSALRVLEAALSRPAATSLDVRAIASDVSGIELVNDLARWREASHVFAPSLQDRRADVASMAELFLAVHGGRLGRATLALSEASIDRLQAYAWPGNVRELENVIERAALTARGQLVDVEEALLQAGRSLGSYSLIEKLGAGGMGEVWRAKHKHLARPAAVKLIQGNPGQGLSPHALRRFRSEAQATARLRSPHTVELYDFGTTEGSGFYYVMELLDGMDLEQLVQTHGPLPPERAVHLLEQALRSLAEAHEAGLVHRDVKPANIFVCKLGIDHDFVKVLDFGLVTELSTPSVERTDVDAVAGTPEFMAPEHASGDEVDRRSDLYSLGCVAYWLLTGDRVFVCNTIGALLIAHAIQKPDPPSKRLGHALPPGLDEWVLAMLAKQPEQRPQSARRALRALSAIALPEPWTRDRAEAWWVGLQKPRRPPEDPSSALDATRPLKPPR